MTNVSSAKLTFSNTNNKLDPNSVSVKNVRSSSIVIESDFKEESEKLKNLAMNNLGDNYNVNQLVGIQ